MSEKIVKVTNGKVLNYKISASGYKTIYGSKVVTANSTISHNLVSESSQNGVYSLGDRIGNMASFVGYFNSIKPDDNSTQKYAVFVLDAAYRTRTAYIQWDADINKVPLTAHSTSSDALADTASATYNGDMMASAYTTAELHDCAFLLCRQFSVVLGGKTYYAQFPNLAEMAMIFGEDGNSGKQQRAFLDSLDPTLSGLSGYWSLEDWCFSSDQNNKRTWSSTWCGSQKAWFLSNNYNNKAYDVLGYSNGCGVIPVFEIPVE